MVAVGYTYSSDPAKVNKAGDTMTGALTLAGDPTLPLHAATRQFVLANAGSGGGGGGGSSTATAQTVAYAASVSLNADQADIFRVVATGALSLAQITGGREAQLVTLEVFASGGAQTVTIAGVADTFTVPAGRWWFADFRYHAADDLWLLLANGGGSGGSAAPAGTPDTGSVTDSSVASNAGIVLSKTADSTAGAGRLAMTNTERTQLGGLSVALSGKAAVGHTHTVDGIVANGIRDSTTFLRGDGVFAVPAGGAGGGGTPSSGSVTDASVASNAGISLSKTADAADRLAMTAAERSKLSTLVAGGVVSGFVPAGSTTPTVTHGLGTPDLIVLVQDQADGRYSPAALQSIVRVDDNTLRFTFSSATTTNKYRYTIAAKSATLAAPQVRDIPTTQAFAASLTINAAAGNFREITATGNLTLNGPASGVNGQMLLLRVIASGAQRVVTFAAELRRPSHIASTLTIPSGRRGMIGLTYEPADGWSVMVAQAV